MHDEARARGYRFDRAKIGPVRAVDALTVTSGQLDREWAHLRRKLAVRSPALLAHWSGERRPTCHPLFQLVNGPVAPWERAPAD